MGEVINKENVIFEVVNRLNRRCSYIKKYNLQWSGRHDDGL